MYVTDSAAILGTEISMGQHKSHEMMGRGSKHFSSNARWLIYVSVKLYSNLFLILFGAPSSKFQNSFHFVHHTKHFKTTLNH